MTMRELIHACHDREGWRKTVMKAARAANAPEDDAGWGEVRCYAILAVFLAVDRDHLTFERTFLENGLFTEKLFLG